MPMVTLSSGVGWVFGTNCRQTDIDAPKTMRNVPTRSSASHGSGTAFNSQPTNAVTTAETPVVMMTTDAPTCSQA